MSSKILYVALLGLREPWEESKGDKAGGSEGDPPVRLEDREPDSHPVRHPGSHQASHLVNQQASHPSQTPREPLNQPPGQPAGQTVNQPPSQTPGQPAGPPATDLTSSQFRGPQPPSQPQGQHRPHPRASYQQLRSPSLPSGSWFLLVTFLHSPPPLISMG